MRKDQVEGGRREGKRFAGGVDDRRRCLRLRHALEVILNADGLSGVHGERPQIQTDTAAVVEHASRQLLARRGLDHLPASILPGAPDVGRLAQDGSLGALGLTHPVAIPAGSRTPGGCRCGGSSWAGSDRARRIRPPASGRRRTGSAAGRAGGRSGASASLSRRARPRICNPRSARQSATAGYAPTPQRGSASRLWLCWLEGSERKISARSSAAKNRGVARGAPSGSSVARVSAGVSSSSASRAARSGSAKPAVDPVTVPARCDRRRCRFPVAAALVQPWLAPCRRATADGHRTTAAGGR